MKKVYEKPCIYMEQFELAAHIASCSYDYNNQESKDSCYATGTMDGADGVAIQIFQGGVPGCLVEEDGTSCNLIYEDNTALFNS